MVEIITFYICNQEDLNICNTTRAYGKNKNRDWEQPKLRNSYLCVSPSRFEKLVQESMKNMEILKKAHDKGQSVPKWRTEERTLNTVKSAHFEFILNYALMVSYEWQETTGKTFPLESVNIFSLVPKCGVSQNDILYLRKLNLHHHSPFSFQSGSWPIKMVCWPMCQPMWSIWDMITCDR